MTAQETDREPARHTRSDLASRLHALRARYSPPGAHRRLVAESGLFDPDFYLRTYFRGAPRPTSPLDHYLRKGWRRRWSPGPDFDVDWYLAVNFDVAAARQEPLQHYLLHGRQEARLRSPTHAAATKALMMRFQSLGFNCEFGTVQRFFGAEPLDLFRFAGTPSADELARALRMRLAAFRQPESIEIDYVPWDETGRLRTDRGTEMAAVVKEHGFWLHAGRDAEKPDALRTVQTRKLGRLSIKLMEDLERGHRICVYLCGGDMRDAVEALAAAIGEYGPTWLVWVSGGESGNPSGSVQRIGPKLLHGYVDTSSLATIRYADWLSICEAAVSLVDAA